jgi:hypothetical protein
LETVCDLANKLLKCKDWEPQDLHASAQKNIPPRKYLDDAIPFVISRNLIVDIPINPQGYPDVYINNTTGLTVNLPGIMNANQLEAAISLAIELAAQPNDTNKPIPREKMIAEDKLTAEGGLSETNTILRWNFNFRTLTHRDLPRTQTHCMVTGDETDDPGMQNNKENAGINNQTHGPHWLCDPLGLPLPQPPQITARMHLEQESHQH